MNKKHNFGVTLVELLVVITIMTIVTALIIPRVRVLNKDRNIRETSRVIGSLLASASNNAIAQGAAGVVFERNRNFVERNDANDQDVFFACTRMYLMRAVPDYNGDDEEDQARLFLDDVTEPLEPKLRVEIPRPLDYDPSTQTFVVRRNDQISFDSSRTFFTIDSDVVLIEPSPGIEFLTFTLAFDDGGGSTPAELEVLNLNQPEFFSGVPAPSLSPGAQGDKAFTIRRQPQLVESSLVELPPGYYIDLRYSGPLDLGNDIDNDGIPEGEDNDESTFTKFGLLNSYPNGPFNGPSSDVFVMFDDTGGINNIQYSQQNVVLGQSLALFVTEYDVENADLAGNVPAIRTSRDILSVAETLWVTVNNSTGGVNVSNNNIPSLPPAPPNLDLGQNVISSARFLSRFRSNAAQ